jgi:hypothetical protein
LTGLPLRYRLITSRTAATSTPIVAATATGPHHHFKLSEHLAVHSSGWLDGWRVGGRCASTGASAMTTVLETAGERLPPIKRPGQEV